MPKPDDDTSVWVAQVYSLESGYLKEKLNQEKNPVSMSQELQNVELCNNNGDSRDYFGFCPNYEILYIWVSLVHGLRI